MRQTLVFFALSLACAAQYVPTNDGSRLFFTSSDRLAGTGQSFRSKLFAWDAAHGVQLVYESPAEYICCISVTGDGSLAAFLIDAENDPTQRRGALLNLRTGQLEIVGSRAVISRNGRYLFTGETLVDRSAGTSRPVAGAEFVGSDGSVLYTDAINLHRIDPDGTDRIVIRAGARFGRLLDADENAATAVVYRAPDSRIVVDTITGRQVDLPSEGGFAGAAFLSRDGQWVTFAAGLPPDYRQRTLLCRADASDCKILKSPPIPALPIALSGDASSVYVSYDGSVNRISRIDTNTGRTEQAFTFAQFYPQVEAPIVPGSLIRFYGANFGDHITVNGREAPLLSPSGGLPVIQIPWDLPDQWVKFTMYGGDSPFETFTRTYPVFDFYPQGFAPGNPGVNEGQSVYGEDWAPGYPFPGEIVHIFAVGLGATDCAVETGKPAPLDRLCRVTRMVNWQWTTAPGTTVPAEVLFAGLAPGTVGLYQIDVRVPPFNGFEFIELSDGVRNPRVAVVHVRQK